MPQPQPDIHQHLIQEAATGNRSSFQAIYELYVGAMLGTAQRILSNRTAAEDVVQDVFVEVYHKLQDFRGESTFGYWLKRITINRALNVLKQERKVRFADIDAGAEVVEEENEEGQFWRQFKMQDIQSAIASLADGYRTVAVLYLFEELSHEEIAHSLGIAPATSKSQLSRAKQKIRTHLVANVRNNG